MAKRKYIICCVCKHKYEKIEEVHSPKNCPNCKEPYWRRPIREHELMKLQDEYFIDRLENKYAFDKMIITVEKILHNIIAGKLKSSAVYLEEEKRHDLVMESLLTFMEKYQNPDFKITGSFIGYLNDLVLNPLYNPKKYGAAFSCTQRATAGPISNK